MPEQLGDAGVHTHLVSDHPHYWEDGGATYHTRYTTWEFFRGQEGDPWKGVVRRLGRASPPPGDGTAPGCCDRTRSTGAYMATEEPSTPRH